MFLFSLLLYVHFFNPLITKPLSEKSVFACLNSYSNAIPDSWFNLYLKKLKNPNL